MAVTSGRLAQKAVAATLLGVAGYYSLWGGEYSAFDLGRLAEQQRLEAARLAETRAQADSLAELVQRLESDPATIEAVARERFGMIRKGETLYRFVDVQPEQDSVSDSDASGSTP